MTEVAGAFEREWRPLPRLVLLGQRPWRVRLSVGVHLTLAVAGAVAMVVGVLVVDVVHQHGRVGRAQGALVSTHHVATTVAADLSRLRHELQVLTSEVSHQDATLQQDTAKLQGDNAALQATQSHVAAQNVQIGAVHTCLSGVQQALNALSVGNQNDALWFVTIVSPSCSTAAAPSG